MACVFRIQPTVQNYDWGIKGSKAKVAQFAAASTAASSAFSQTSFQVNEDEPYAELWMGTHPKSPSLVYDDASPVPLSTRLASHADELIGPRVLRAYADAKSGALPFLFKVLSISKALSIQSHPDKPTARALFEAQPQVYKDPNHKPEMALALTRFVAMCGFRPLPDIAAALKATPELLTLMPSGIVQAFYDAAVRDNQPEYVTTTPTHKTALRELFSALMTASPAVFRPQLDKLVQRFCSDPLLAAGGVGKEVVEMVLRLEGQFPGDIGVFCPFLLNIMRLDPGEAIFLGAGEPHAYVEGECIECMANSDNVIRAGLTPKLRDVPNLVATLTYEASAPSKHHVQPTPWPEDVGDSRLFRPPVSEFSIIETKLELAGSQTRTKTKTKTRHPPVDGPSILIVTAGRGVLWWEEGPSEFVKQMNMDLNAGDAVFVGAGVPLEFVLREDEREAGLVVYRAFCDG